MPTEKAQNWEKISITGMENHAEKYLEIEARIKELKNQVKVLERQQKPHKEALQMVMENADIGTMNGFEVDYKRSITNRLNQQKLKEDYPDVFSDCYEESTTRRMVVKRTSLDEPEEPAFNF